MKFTIARGFLREELELLANVVTKKDKDTPALSCVRIATTSTGIELAGTSSEVSIRTQCAVHTEGEGTILVDAKRLTDIVKSLDADVISVERIADDNTEKLKLQCGGSEMKFPCVSTSAFPVLPDFPSTEAAIINAKILAEMISRVLFAIDPNEPRVPPGALLMLGDSNAIMATDGQRLSTATYTGEGVGAGANVEAIVPVVTLKALVSFAGHAGGEAHIVTTPNHIFLKFNNRLLISRRAAGKYPGIAAAIAKYAKGSRVAVINRQKFAQSIKRGSLMTDNDCQRIKLEFAASIPELRFNATHSVLGEASEAIPISYTGTSFSAFLNPGWLLQFLASAGTDEVTCVVNEERDPLLFGAYGDNFSHQFLLAQTFVHPERQVETPAPPAEPKKRKTKKST